MAKKLNKQERVINYTMNKSQLNAQFRLSNGKLKAGWRERKRKQEIRLIRNLFSISISFQEALDFKLLILPTMDSSNPIQIQQIIHW